MKILLMSRRWLAGCGLAAILAAGLWLARKPATAPPAEPAGGANRPAAGAAIQAAHSDARPIAANEPIIHINAREVLASVNGRALKLADLVPGNFAEANQDPQFSPETYHYLLDRAVNRELILQTARIQGVGLNDSQRKQLAEFRQQRKQREPGLVQVLNNDSSQIDFEMRDAEAFMLQAALLNKAGASPNVSAEDVQAYYAQHADDFAGLPADETARKQAWIQIDVQIRNLLAPVKREQFQSRLVTYMDQIKANAKITLTPRGVSQ